MPNVNPMVAVAAVCQTVLEEKDKVLSAIRLVDTFWVIRPEGIPADMVPSVQLTILISLKSGDVIGRREFRLVMRSPTGTSTEIHRSPLVFNGGEHGVNVKGEFRIATDEFGLYWFDVICEEVVLTSIPFKLLLGPPPQEPIHSTP